MKSNSKIYIAGHTGMVGSAILRALINKGYNNLIFKKSSELDLTNQKNVLDFFKQEKPEYVFLAAAKVGGILANDSYGGQFLYENLMIQANVINASHLSEVKKLLFLGSSCIYPKNSTNPIKESYLLNGILEKTNEAYSIAKISGLKMCEYYNKQYGCNYISIMPTNLYGPNDNYDLQSSHVLPALLKKFYDAKTNNKSEVVVWGSGLPKREFLHVDDLAEACVLVIKENTNEILFNVGSGTEISISDLAKLIKKIIGYDGDIIFDNSKPDGVMQKLIDSSRIKNLGWEFKINLETGIKKTLQNSFK
ncbi:GDP-L-fucose synthase [bacterium]|nr:GDP-L-fucose synthase [bacterium]